MNAATAANIRRSRERFIRKNPNLMASAKIRGYGKGMSKS